MTRALIVEHQQMLRESLESVLEGAGYDADSVETLAAARSMFDAADYELVLANDRLPDGRGYDLASEASEMGIKSFLVSGNSEEVTLTPAGKPYLRRKLPMADLAKAFPRPAASE